MGLRPPGELSSDEDQPSDRDSAVFLASVVLALSNKIAVYFVINIVCHCCLTFTCNSYTVPI